MPVSRGIDARQPLQPLGCLHRTLDLFRAAEVQQHHLTEHIDAVLIAVQFVILAGSEAIDPTDPRCMSASSSLETDCGDLLRPARP